MKDSYNSNHSVTWVAHYDPMTIRRTRFTEEARAISTALMLGVVMYGAAVGMENTSAGRELQRSAYADVSTELSDKKTCIMLAWQQQSGGLDRAQCAKYLEQWDARRPAIAQTR